MNRDQLEELKSFYRPYEEMLKNSLIEVGIEPLPSSTKQINETGKPVFPTLQKYIFNLVPLRPNECVLYTIKANGLGVYAFPDNGIGLRYLVLGTNINRIKTLKKFRNLGLLAAVSDGSNIYVLTEDGKVLHNNSALTEEIRIFDKVEYCESIWKQNIKITAVEEYMKANFKDDVVDLDKGNDCYYYDTEKRAFFLHIVRGGYHDPIEMTNIRLTKRQMLERLVNVPSQNRYFHRIGLKEKLADFDGLILAWSAGSMNCAAVVYAGPELDGEAIDPTYQRWILGLGITNINIFPHFQILRDDWLDGMRLIEDITFTDSMGHEIIALNDGTYITIEDGVTTLFGEAYRILDGHIEMICQNGMSVVLKHS